MTASDKAATPPLPRFRPGDAVRVDDRPPALHCRAPWYLRGRAGVVAEVLGVFRDPERLAQLKPGWPKQVLYSVRFKQSELWPGYTGPALDHLDADIAENWLVAPQAATTGKPATKQAAKKKARGP